jgi:hypothetical protein
MKPNNYNAVMDPNAGTQNLVNPLASVGGTIIKKASVTNLAESIGGSLGNLAPQNMNVGEMREQARGIMNDFSAMTGANGYDPVGRAVQAAATAGTTLLHGVSTAWARLKVGR